MGTSSLVFRESIWFLLRLSFRLSRSLIVSAYTVIMRIAVILCALLATVTRAGIANKKCGADGLFEGRPCASTGSYSSDAKGWCGCGNRDENVAHWWVKTSSVGSVNEAFYEGDGQGGLRCGEVCGTCFKLTATGGVPSTEFQGAAAGTSRTIMIVDNCPRNALNAKWCGQQTVNSTNTMGYRVHFNLQNFYKQLDNGEPWDHPEVTYEETDCDAAHFYDKEVPDTDTSFDCTCTEDAEW